MNDPVFLSSKNRKKLGVPFLEDAPPREEGSNYWYAWSVAGESVGRRAENSFLKYRKIVDAVMWQRITVDLTNFSCSTAISSSCMATFSTLNTNAWNSTIKRIIPETFINLSTVVGMYDLGSLPSFVCFGVPRSCAAVDVSRRCEDLEPLAWQSSVPRAVIEKRNWNCWRTKSQC